VAEAKARMHDASRADQCVSREGEQVC